ncbi:MAG: PepSY domain-containing protein [Sedimentisphaerales bacterium]|nr:PepSY domain-containing protein [Sedimentisphaerales bacterium]
MKTNKDLQVKLCVGLMFAAIGLIVPCAFAGPPWERAIPQEVVNAAIDFADLNEVSSVTRVKVNCAHTNYYEIHGVKADVNRTCLVAVNPDNNEVVKEIRFCPRHEQFSTEVAIDETQALAAANAYLTDHNLMIPSDFVLDDVNLRQLGEEYYYRIHYKHYHEGFPVKADFLTLKVDANYGDIRSYSKVYHNITTSWPSPSIDGYTAISMARTFVGAHTGIDPNLPVGSNSLEIVYPNRYFDSCKWQWTEQEALVYNVRFVETTDPDADRVIDVWVDANSGEIQGGETYETPLAEKFATTNQHHDLDIWDDDWGGDDWDPLPRMQYNATEHRLGWDPPANTKNQVVNAINATNHVWMLQTHGGFSANRPYAIIDATDNVNLYPADIPANTVFWALLSCCHSGDTGAGGNDFKTTFINQGTRLFTGYVGSINPDNYEHSLSYYLQMGYHFANAHEAAEEQTNPDFEIVYAWRGGCYNAMRLAPLFVTVDGPDNPVFPLQEFNMTARVRNRESDGHATATNVQARLVIPAGFTRIAGNNPQNLGNITYNNENTATWTVRANALTRPGTYTFDAIVWSDNLGVEVDDPDNPYHKCEVDVMTLDFDLNRIVDFRDFSMFAQRWLWEY